MCPYIHIEIFKYLNIYKFLFIISKLKVLKISLISEGRHRFSHSIHFGNKINEMKGNKNNKEKIK